MSVLVAAPVALLAQGYTKIFLGDIEADTLHGAFNIPVKGSSSNDINYGLNKYDMIVVDEASMISSHIFEKMAATINCLNLRPVLIFAGDKYQQQPLRTVDGRTSATTSIINDHTFHRLNAVQHTLYQQFRITDSSYAAFLDCIQYTQPSQQQVDEMQQDIVLCPPGPLSDDAIWEAYNTHANSTVMTVSRRGAQRVNNIVVSHLFSNQRPLSTIACASVADCEAIYPQRNMKVIFTENRDKQARAVNGKEATILSAQKQHYHPASAGRPARLRLSRNCNGG